MSKISSYTDVNGRSGNQDRFLIVPKIIDGDKIIFTSIFDGMGGTDSGDIAASIAKELTEIWIEEEYPNIDNNPVKLKESMADLIIEINEKVIEYKNKHNVTLGSTMAFLILRNEEYIACNIGDSRIYKFGSKNIQITKDHSFVELEVARGVPKEEAIKSKNAHKLTQCIGMEDQTPEPDFFKGKYKDGDYFFLCSDGMYNTMTIKDLDEIISDKKLGTKDKLAMIANRVKDNNEKDNITGILVQIC